MDALLAQLQADPATNAAIIATIVIAVVDFVTGTLRAIGDKSFTWDALDVWVRKHLVAVGMIVIVLLTGRVVGDITVGNTTLSVLTATGLLAAGTFIAAGVKSIIDNLNSSVANPTPTV